MQGWAKHLNRLFCRSPARHHLVENPRARLDQCIVSDAPFPQFPGMGREFLENRAHGCRRGEGMQFPGHPANALKFGHALREALEDRRESRAPSLLEACIPMVGRQVSNQENRMMGIPVAHEGMDDASRSREPRLPPPVSVDQFEHRGHFFCRLVGQAQGRIFHVTEILVEGGGGSARLAGDFRHREVQGAPLPQEVARGIEQFLPGLDGSRAQDPPRGRLDSGFGPGCLASNRPCLGMGLGFGHGILAGPRPPHPSGAEAP